MSNVENQNLLKQKEEIDKTVQEIFNRVLAAYRIVVEQIGEDSFDEISELVGREINKTVRGVGHAFKEYLFDKIKEKFIHCWKDQEIDKSLAILEIAKRNCVTEEEGWRPTNKTAEEQLRPHLVKMMLMQREMLKKQIEEQNEKINSILPKVEEMREKLRNRIKQQSEMMNKIDKDVQKTEEGIEKLDEITEKIHSLDC